MDLTHKHMDREDTERERNRSSQCCIFILQDNDGGSDRDSDDLGHGTDRL